MTGQKTSLTALPGGADEAAELLQTTCANPRCSKLFTKVAGPGRPSAFCDEDCRRETQRERRRLQSRLRHHVGQVEQLRLLVANYERSAVVGGDEEPDDEFLSPDAVRVAQDAVLEARVLARFLSPDSGDYAADLLNLFHAVAPVIEHSRKTG